MASVDVQTPSRLNPPREQVAASLDLSATPKGNVKQSPARKKATKSSYRRSLSLDRRELDELKGSQDASFAALNVDMARGGLTSSAPTSAPNSPKSKKLSHSSNSRKNSASSADQNPATNLVLPGENRVDPTVVDKPSPPSSAESSPRSSKDKPQKRKIVVKGLKTTDATPTEPITIAMPLSARETSTSKLGASPGSSPRKMSIFSFFGSKARSSSLGEKSPSSPKDKDKKSKKKKGGKEDDDTIDLTEAVFALHLSSTPTTTQQVNSS